MIRLDIPNRLLEAELDAGEIARRRAAQPPWQPRAALSGWLRRYARQVTSAGAGAVMSE